MPITGAPISFSTKIERRFYAVVRWFGLILASFTFLAALGAGFFSLHTLTSTADTTIHPPTLSYDKFRQNLEASQQRTIPSATDTTLQQKEQEAARAKEDVDYELKLKPHLTTILEHLTKYAAVVDTPKPSEQAVDDFVRNDMSYIRALVDDSMAWNYVDGLEKATGDLANDGERLAKLPSDDPRRIRWDNFLTGYSTAFKARLRDEMGRIQNEQAKVTVNKAGALITLYGAGALFLGFVIATILLVLLRIERNTRPV